jgi:predicted RNase H-like HicB family nuclease
MKYQVVLKKTEEGVSVSCPGLPGCWSQGETEEEAIENIQDAIQEYLAAVAESLKGEDVREVDVAVYQCRKYLGSTIVRPSRRWRRRDSAWCARVVSISKLAASSERNR